MTPDNIKSPNDDRANVPAKPVKLTDDDIEREFPYKSNPKNFYSGNDLKQEGAKWVRDNYILYKK